MLKFKISTRHGSQLITNLKNMCSINRKTFLWSQPQIKMIWTYIHNNTYNLIISTKYILFNSFTFYPFHLYVSKSFLFRVVTKLRFAPINHIIH